MNYARSSLKGGAWVIHLACQSGIFTTNEKYTLIEVTHLVTRRGSQTVNINPKRSEKQVCDLL
jgi:hypothetical protein